MNASESSTSTLVQSHGLFHHVQKNLVIVITVVAVLSCCVLLFCWAVRYARQATRVCNCQSQVVQIKAALERYYSTHRCYPPAFLADENGKPVHSWRVLILPVGEVWGERVPSYDFEEPWDSPHNRRVLTNHPFRERFACPLDDNAIASGLTSYVAVVGDNTMWPGRQSRSETGKITGDTILLIEIPNSDIYWTEPRDISFQEALNLFSASKNGLRNSNRHGALYYLTVSGDYRRFSSIETVEEFARLLQVGTKAGGSVK